MDYVQLATWYFILNSVSNKYIVQMIGVDFVQCGRNNNIDKWKHVME